MEKYKILLVVAGETGLQYHRQLVPHYYLAHDEQFEISVTKSIDLETDKVLKNFHLVHFLRQIDESFTNRTVEIANRLRQLGVKILLDIDDYWFVDKTHQLSKGHRQLGYSMQIEQAIEVADYVTVTHELLASKVRSTFVNNKSYNNVDIIPNAIWPDEPQFQIRNIDNSRIRFGWIGGVHHRPDVELMKYSLSRMYTDKTIRDKFQICLGGFNVNVNFTDENEVQLAKLGIDIAHAKTLNFKQLADYFISKNVAPPEPEYLHLELAFTDDYKSLKHDKQYMNYLRQLTPLMEHISFDKEYRRLWGTDTYNYGKLYNEIDVALVPLVDNEFNQCKSQLKIIEAGFMKKAVIVSEVHPYTIDCINRKNCLTVRPNMNLMDWFLHMKRMINEPNLRQDLAEAMHETVKDKYHIKTTTEVRKQLYKYLIEKG